jgi:hypothetical protein
LLVGAGSPRDFPQCPLTLNTVCHKRFSNHGMFARGTSPLLASQRRTLADSTELKTTPAPIEVLESEPSPLSNAPALRTAAAFIRRDWLRLLAVSALLLIPCFWHRHITASDLGSHLYNAWLAQLIRHGQAPGLWLSGQRTNVLFDLMLSGCGSIFGLFVAEKIVVSLCVLAFFWGAFALVSAATQRPPWFLSPLLALVAYGWTFHLGLFNYYLSVGLSFFCLAILWRGRNWERAAIVPLAALTAVAHPFGLIWLVCAYIYIAVAERLQLRHQIVFLLASAGAIWAVRYYFNQHTITEMEPDHWYWFTGLDQLMLFGNRYRLIRRAVLAFALIALAVDAIGRRRQEPRFWKTYSFPLQLYIVVELAVFLFPRGIQFPHRVAIALITERLTSISAVAGCCLLATMRPSKWHLATSLAILAVFARFLYQDTATVNRIEAQAENLVRTLPPNQRVLASLFQLDDSRILIQHSIELACIGHCFSYGNYEPGSAIFRVRATPGNPYVLPDYETATDTEEGTYVVQPADLPISQVYQCTDTGLVLCIRPLKAGEQNNSAGVYP